MALTPELAKIVNALQRVTETALYKGQSPALKRAAGAAAKAGATYDEIGNAVQIGLNVRGDLGPEGD